MEDIPSLALRVAEELFHFDQLVVCMHVVILSAVWSFCFRYRPSLLSFGYLVLNT